MSCACNRKEGVGGFRLQRTVSMVVIELVELWKLSRDGMGTVLLLNVENGSPYFFPQHDYTKKGGIFSAATLPLICKLLRTLHTKNCEMTWFFYSICKKFRLFFQIPRCRVHVLTNSVSLSSHLSYLLTTTPPSGHTHGPHARLEDTKKHSSQMHRFCPGYFSALC